MANVFLEGGHEEIETAILLENAKQCDLGELSSRYENAVAFTDGTRVFINSDDNLARILPDYNKGMLKWLLWHEKYHLQLKHHPRFFDYMKEIRESDESFNVTMEEVNIIMDILVHDSLSKMFPELVETAIHNLAQMRNRNSLGYTFTGKTLEDMLDEYKKHKKGEDKEDEGGKEGKGEDEGEDKEEGEKKKDDKKKGHGESKTPSKPKKDKKEDRPEDGEPDEGEKPEEEESSPSGEHDKTDWSGLEDIDTEEFIDEDEGKRLDDKINKLRRKKIKLGRLAQTLSGLATTKRQRTYRLPSMIQMGDGCIFKGKTPGRVALYLIFDASGSMGSELETFKELITKAIPQALDCPCEWFSGYNPSEVERRCKNPEGKNRDYYKGKYKDILKTYASGGYNDDGDRVIELCVKAEEKGFTPIGITDGGGAIYNPEVLKKLKRTVLVGPNGHWLKEAKQINPNIQTLELER